MSRLTKQAIMEELKNNINLFQVTPSHIIKTYSVQEFKEILDGHAPAYIFMLRLKSIETSFVANDNFEHAAIIRDYRNKHK